MKRKVGELNNIPIVEGDPNLLKSNEILHKGGGQLSKRDNTGEIKDLGSGSGGGGDNEEVWYIPKIQGRDLSSNTIDLLKGISTNFNLIEVYVQTYGGGAYQLSKCSIESTKELTGYYNIECFSFSGGIYSRNYPSKVHINIKSDTIENIFDLYLNVFGTDIPPEEFEQVKLMMNNIIQEVNDNYDCVNKEQMLAYLESNYNN